MDRLLSNELAKHVGAKAKVKGWIHSTRSFGRLLFLILRDRSGHIQVVIQDKELARKIADLQVGSILSIRGDIVSAPEADLGIEIHSPEIEIEVAIREAPPVPYYKPDMQVDLETILDHRAISLRHSEIQAVFRIQAEIAHGYRLYMHDVVGSYEYFSPNVIGASSEGGAEFFNVDYYGYTATLAQSSQLYKQIMVGVNERVFALMPFFRAEPSHTPRHLSEGKQFEFEMGFFDDWKEILDIQEGCIKAIVKRLQTHCAKELKALGNPLVKCPLDVPFPRVTFADAQEIYFKRTGIDERDEPDLSPAAERELCQHALEKFGTEFIFITDWKIGKRPFYSYPNPKNPDLTNTFDLLCAGTEITSGGQRRHTYESMVEGILLKGMDPANFDDYLSIFKYGMPPHGGFGMGLERLTMTMLRLKNIREASLFPSDPKRIAGNRLKAKIFFGGENVRNEIVRRLKDTSCKFEHTTHEETPTSEDSARVRGVSMEEGVKALILVGKQSKKNYQFCISSHLKLDMKAVAQITGEKCEFESPEVIEKRFGLKIGGIPPFGNLLNLDTYFDQKLQKLPTVSFNCGLRTESIRMGAKELFEIVQPKFVDFSKE